MFNFSKLLLTLIEPSASETDAGSPIDQITMDKVRASLGAVPIGGVIEFEDYSAALDLPIKFMELNGDIINDTNYDADHDTDWVDDVGTTVLDGETLPLKYDSVVVMKDTKANNVDGGTFNNAAWRTRVLTTAYTENAQPWCVLASNQFTLQAGTYEIEASAPAAGVTYHKAKLYNITDSADTIIGTSTYANTTRSFVRGIFTITSAKVFELQHRCTTSTGTTGFGAASNFGVLEVYSIVKIKKISTRVMKIL